MSNHQSLPVTGSHWTGMEDLHNRFLHTTLEDCPKPSVPFLGEREQTFGNDLRAFGSGYAIFAHLAIFSVFALVSFFPLVSANNISFGFCILVDQISLAAYFCRLRWGWEEKEVKMMINIVHLDSLPLRQVGAPPLVDLLLGREDKWMLKERGEAALDYLNFQRMLIIISLQINLFSAIAFLVNYFAPTPRTNLKEHEDGFSFTPFVNQTSLSNLRQDSDWHYYHIFASSLLPYLVLLTAFLFIPTCLTSGDNPPSRSSTSQFVSGCPLFAKEPFCILLFPSTVVVHGLNQKEHSPMVIRNYFQQMHPHVTIR